MAGAALAVGTKRLRIAGHTPVAGSAGYRRSVPGTEGQGSGALRPARRMVVAPSADGFDCTLRRTVSFTPTHRDADEITNARMPTSA